MRKFLSFFLLAGLLAWAGVADAQREYMVRVGNPTDSSYRYPSNTIYRCSYTQMIFPFSSMPSVPDLKINEISFYYTGTGGSSSARSQNWTVYMKNVTTASFSNDSAYIPVTSSDRVFVGKFNIPTSAGWVKIKLDRQFIYKNSYGNHLLIAIYDSTSPYSTRNFRITEGADYYSLQYVTDSLNYSPNPEGNISNFGGTGRYKARRKNMPVMRLGYNYDTVATLPYTTNFSNTNDNLKWHLKNFPDGKNAQWSFNNELRCGYEGTYQYHTDHANLTVIAERKLQLGNSDSIRVSFNATVGGERSYSSRYDFLSVYLVPKDTNWSPNYRKSIYESPNYFLGVPTDSTKPYVLPFGEPGLMNSVKLTSISSQRLTSTIRNPYPGQVCKLVFVWRNDASSGTGTGVRVDDLSVTEVNRPPYNPRSTARWMAFAKRSARYNTYISFNMQDIRNFDTISYSQANAVVSGTYMGNSIWCTMADSRSAIFRKFLNGNTLFDGRSFSFTFNHLGSLPEESMQYNPADGNMYVIVGTEELYKLPVSDPSNYSYVGRLPFRATAFAINARGEAYALEGISSRHGELYKISLNDASIISRIGVTGFNASSYYNQSMAFDYATDELFMAIGNVVNDYESGLYCINTSNAQLRYVGKLADIPMCLTALCAVQTASQGITTASATELRVFPNPAKDELRVNGVENGTMIMVYDMTGKLVAQQKATENTVISVSGLTKGVYVLSAGERKIKFVKE